MSVNSRRIPMKKLALTNKDLTNFLDTVENKTRKADALRLFEIFQKVASQPTKFWPPSIIGFGEYHYKHESGGEGYIINVGFSPHKACLVLYVIGSVGDNHPLMDKIGKYKAGKVFLYINKLADVDENLLEKIIKLSYRLTIEKYG